MEDRLKKSILAVRRAAIEALSHTYLGRPIAPHDMPHAPAAIDVARERYAEALADAYTAMVVTIADDVEAKSAMSPDAYARHMADLRERARMMAFVGLREAARGVQITRAAAAKVWTEMCVASESSNAVPADLEARHRAAIQDYADVAQISYDEAFHALDRGHCDVCSPHPVPQRGPGVPSVRSHPGLHGVNVELARARLNTTDIDDLSVAMHLAVMSHPDMASLRATVWQNTPLDDAAKRDGHSRLTVQQTLGITAVIATNHQQMLEFIAKSTTWPMDLVVDTVADYVQQYRTYHDFAKREWHVVVGMKFDAHDLAHIAKDYHNIAAVANALSLSVAEVLVLLRTLVAADEANAQNRLRKTEA